MEEAPGSNPDKSIFLYIVFFDYLYMDSEKSESKKTDIYVKEKRGFYIHFVIYILVNIAIIAQWYYITGGEGFVWFVTTTVGWGIGIIAHFIAVFVVNKSIK